MIKELLLAIALGAILGFGVTGGFFVATKNRGNVANSVKTEIVSPETVTGDNDSDAEIDQISGTNPLNIELPENNSIVSNSKIDFKGSTTPDSTLVVDTPIKNYIITVDKTGNFNTTIDIESGANIIKITSIDPNDNQTETEIIVTYSTAQI